MTIKVDKTMRSTVATAILEGLDTTDPLAVLRRLGTLLPTDPCYISSVSAPTLAELAKVAGAGVTGYPDRLTAWMVVTTKHPDDPNTARIIALTGNGPHGEELAVGLCMLLNSVPGWIASVTEGETP